MGYQQTIWKMTLSLSLSQVRKKHLPSGSRKSTVSRIAVWKEGKREREREQRRVKGKVSSLVLGLILFHSFGGKLEQSLEGLSWLQHHYNIADITESFGSPVYPPGC